jgi:hypothetical protein
MPPVAGDKIDNERQPLGQLAPKSGGMAGLEHQYFIAGRKVLTRAASHVPVPESRIDHDGVHRFEDRFQPLQNRGSEPGEFGTVMIDDWTINRPQDPIPDVARTWDLKEVSTGPGGHVPLCPIASMHAIVA